MQGRRLAAGRRKHFANENVHPLLTKICRPTTHAQVLSAARLNLIPFSAFSPLFAHNLPLAKPLHCYSFVVGQTSHTSSPQKLRFWIILVLPE